MGTNYYLEGKTCEHCGQTLPDAPRLHIGKSSAGWAFTLHIMPEEGINDLFDWIKRWDAPGARIVDEYGRAISSYEMLKIVVDRHRPEVPAMTATKLRQNHAFVGANNMLVHVTDRHSEPHGVVMWSRCKGEFS